MICCIKHCFCAQFDLQVPQGWGGIGQVGMAMAPMLQYNQGSSQVPPDTDSRVPVINLKDGTRLAGDDAPRRKDLEQWLMEHPGFVADTGAFIPVSPALGFHSVLSSFTLSCYYTEILCLGETGSSFVGETLPGCC